MTSWDTTFATYPDVGLFAEDSVVQRLDGTPLDGQLHDALAVPIVFSIRKLSREAKVCNLSTCELDGLKLKASDWHFDKVVL